ncbi:hypothetical protein [Anatilimnocola floriformis]|uniref:hypothetical protein n=1 Tax=Anatilimnocola floriformis TaxID=2948575 RepID=UPI0020C39392|nr:hypothetical protein [Anatilimnocola floriformis]
MRRLNWFYAAGGISLLFAGNVAFGQAVQLPTFQVFSVDTTVSVPDGGGMLLGGMNRAADSSVTRGLPLGSKLPGLGRLGTNSGISSTRSASNMSVHASIIDNHELDEAVLATAAARRGSSLTDKQALATQQRADFLTRNLATTDRPVVETKSAAPSVEEIRRKNELAAANRDAEALSYFTKAQAAEAEQKPGVAKVYYQMVARRATGELKLLAETRLAALDPRAKSLAVK